MVSFLEDNEPRVKKFITIKSPNAILNLKNGDYTDHFTHNDDIGDIYGHGKLRV